MLENAGTEVVLSIELDTSLGGSDARGNSEPLVQYVLQISRRQWQSIELSTSCILLKLQAVAQRPVTKISLTQSYSLLASDPHAQLPHLLLLSCALFWTKSQLHFSPFFQGLTLASVV